MLLLLEEKLFRTAVDIGANIIPRVVLVMFVSI